MSWKLADAPQWWYMGFWLCFLLAAMFGGYWVIYLAVKAALKA